MKTAFASYGKVTFAIIILKKNHYAIRPIKTNKPYNFDRDNHKLIHYNLKIEDERAELGDDLISAIAGALAIKGTPFFINNTTITVYMPKNGGE